MEEAGEGKKGIGEGGGHRCSFLIHDAVGENLFPEILLRLPLDDIFRCKAVCKRWLSLIQNPLFAACYTNKQKKKNSSLSCIVYPHPQQKSPVLIPTYEDHDGETAKRLEFSLDFIPNLRKLLGADNHRDLLQQADDDKDNFAKEENRAAWSKYYYVNITCVLDEDIKNSFIQRKPDDLDTKLPTRYYSTRNFILGSSNGLLLCAPLLFRPRTYFESFPRVPKPVFDDFTPSYVVCNPYTKQWLQVPPPPPSSSSISPHAASAGFVSDFERGGGGCWFKIVRLPLDFESPHRRSLELQVFSSYSWEWTTIRVSSLSQPIGPDNSTITPVAVTLLNKDDNGDVGSCRLCWLLNDTQAIVYDPRKDVVDAVIEVIQPCSKHRDPWEQMLVLDAICVSKGCLWAGSVRFGFHLRIYRASGKEWEMVEELDMSEIYNRMGCLKCNAFVGMNPDDPQQVYLRSFKTVALLNLKTKSFKVVGALEGQPGPKNCIQGSSIICDNPPWPTPLPSPPSPSSS